MSISIELIKKYLIQYILENRSGGEVVLSIGESLLLVMDACIQANVDSTIIDQLNLLYIEGIKSKEDLRFIKEIQEILVSKKYNVKSDPITINEDPTRRYFETQLAYYLLQNNAEELNQNELVEFTQNLRKRLYSLPAPDDTHIKKAEKILKGEMDTILNKYETEYAQIISMLAKNSFYGLSKKACKNLLELARSTSLSTLNTQIDQTMPADIYSDSVFTMGMDGRGRIIKKEHDKVRTTAKGLMKSISPLPMYYDVANAVDSQYDEKTKEQTASPFQRSADQATFMIESRWTQLLFSRMTQLYSNGISSTTLAQIRNMILEKRLGHVYYKGHFQKNMTVFSALMVYNSGGHSFFEIFEVFKLPLCRELIGGEPGLVKALEEDKMMYKWLCMDQSDAYEKALHATRNYLHFLLSKKIVNAEFKNKRMSVLSLPPEQITLHFSVVYQELHELEQLIQVLGDVDAANSKNWTALMVASQLGKTDQVKLLLTSGADIRKQVDGLSSLELAVKNSHFKTTELLLKEGAVVKRAQKAKGGLKARVPALYLACRQSDMDILTLLLKQKTLNVDDKKEAILCALKIENLEAIKVIIKQITQDERHKFFTEKYKFKLLKEAVKLGNTQLIKGIMELDIFPSFEQLDCQSLLNTAAEKGFLPTVELLLQLYFNHTVKQKSEQEILFSINLDPILITALEHSHFNLGIFLIMRGANIDLVSSKSGQLNSFAEYIRKSEYHDFFYIEEVDLGIISIKLKEKKLLSYSELDDESFNSPPKSLTESSISSTLGFFGDSGKINPKNRKEDIVNPGITM
ncbi:Ribulose-5-phosphate 4-epimerase and related epimerases and aldolases [Legionella steigerwaltii]|uniref:Ankyrin repeats (3 copies) n=1 Tax=Legionella steigerwaltii TaxID=460 RepID=A0A378L855_9GAMM|nr:ankyrin repeat domain-containing protein [Legionella steigerwaltii]KTD77706.1 Ankyrin repeats (3 copies) [Legionella steigerwaltii]STY23016.1 Ribulose-5-phosphate 4-epimerase and related epimerases and aldolases [Legionella steigerwaltii]